MISTHSLKCYYETGKGTDGYATALTPAMMKEASSYTGFDFSNTWFIDSNSYYPYPQLVKCPQVKIASISIQSLPNKTEYFTTDKKIDLTGGVISVNYEGGGSSFVDMKEYMVSYTFKAGIQTVTVEYAGNTATFTVNKKGNPEDRYQ